MVDSRTYVQLSSSHRTYLHLSLVIGKVVLQSPRQKIPLGLKIIRLCNGMTRLVFVRLVPVGSNVKRLRHTEGRITKPTKDTVATS